MSSRENIISAARELFTTKGYDATSPRDIMDMAHTGQGSFYHHFRSKSQLAKEVLNAVCDDLLGIGRQQLRQDCEPLARIESYLHAEREALRGCRLGRFAYDPALEEAHLREPTTRYFKEVESLLVDAFQSAESSNGKIGVRKPEDLAATSLAVVQGGYVLARIHNDPRYLRRAVDGLWSLLSE
jgi:TetR/AcrR family transcriptional regulator, transcriptional repressor for nem operon